MKASLCVSEHSSDADADPTNIIITSALEFSAIFLVKLRPNTSKEEDCLMSPAGTKRVSQSRTFGSRNFYTPQAVCILPALCIWLSVEHGFIVACGPWAAIGNILFWLKWMQLCSLLFACALAVPVEELKTPLVCLIFDVEDSWLPNVLFAY